MKSLVSDPSVGANFAVLLIVRRQDSRLVVSATVFRRSEEPLAARVFIVGGQRGSPRAPSQILMNSPA